MLETESVLPFSEAAARLPRFRGKRVNVSTIWRWARKGLHGQRLEVVRLGHRFLTSVEALDRFAAKLATIEIPPRQPARERPRRPTASGRRRSVESAKRKLGRAGI